MKKEVFILLLTFTVSCATVLEDRTVCPSWLLLYIQGGENYSSLLMRVSEGENLVIEEHLDTYSKEVELEVERTTLSIDAFCNLTSNTVVTKDQLQAIPNGLTVDSLYIARKSITVKGENMTDTLVMYPQFIPINVHVINSGVLQSAILKVENTSGGVSLSGEDIGERISLYPSPKQSGVNSIYKFNIFRQTHNLEMLEINMYSSENNKLERVTTYHLGERLLLVDYDMTSQNIVPVNITIDFSRLEISIVVGGWEYIEDLDIVF